MAVLLKQSTAVNIALGPFVDSTDGVTPEDSLTISQADVRLKKNDGSWAQKADATAATHEENGWYEVPLGTGDTDTLGTLIVAVNESGALPVWREFQVVPANVYDSLIGGSDALDVNATQWGGTAVASANVLIDGAITAAKIATDAIDADALAADAVAELQNGLATAAALTTVDTVVDGIKAVTDNLPDSGALTSIAQAADLATVDSNVDAILVDTGTTLPATLTGIEGKIDTVDGVVDSILVDTAEIGAAGAGLSAIPWNAAWDAEVQSEVQDAIEANHLDHLLAATYDPASKPGAADALLNELVENDGGVARFTANALEEAPTGGSAPTAGEIADAVWEEAIADHSGTSGSTAEQLAAAGSAGDPWATELPGAYGAGTAGKIVGDSIDAAISSRASQTSVDTVDNNVDAILEDTGTTLPATLSTIAGYVDTEVAAIKAKTDLIPGDIDGYSYEEVVTLVAAVLLGRASGLNTSEAIYHALDDSKARISAAVDRHGNRGIVTRDAT